MPTPPLTDLRPSRPAISTPLVLVTPDKFRGSLTATEAAAAIIEGMASQAAATYVAHPVGDGGEGSVHGSARHGFELVNAATQDALGGNINAAYARRSFTDLRGET